MTLLRPVLPILEPLLAGVIAASVPAQGPERGAPEEPQALVVPVHGVIQTTTVALVERALRRASGTGITQIVLDVDTPGGDIDAMRGLETILQSLRDSRLQTIAYVRHQAFSAGAYVALACSRTFMAPGASIGAVVPVAIGPGGVAQLEDDVRDKMLSALRAEMRALIERRGGSATTAKLAEAMVDPRLQVFEITRVDRDGVESTSVVDLDELRRLEADGIEIRNRRQIGSKPPLTLTAEEASRWGFSSGTVPSLEALIREELHLPASAVERLEHSWSESAAAWLDGLRMLLFIAGFVLLLVELKTPGFAIPGVLGVALLTLGLVGSYLVGLAEWTEILLFFLGIAAVAVEMFVMPGTIVFGLVGLLCILLSLILSQQPFFLPESMTQRQILEQNMLQLLILALGVIGCAALVWRFLPKTPFFNRVLLGPPESSSLRGGATRAAARGPGPVVGMLGAAVSDLRPAGLCELDGDRFDVVSGAGFIERGAAVRVVEVEGNRIVVDRAPGAGERGEVSIPLLLLLVMIGLGCIIAEVFFVSFGVLGFTAAASLVTAVFLAFIHHGAGVGFAFLIGCAIAAPAVLVFAFRALPNTPIGRRLLLSGPARGDVSRAAEEPGIHRLLGREGEADSDLRPAGFARIDGVRVDVVSRGEPIARGQRVRVIEVEGNRVVVKGVDGTTASPS